MAKNLKGKMRKIDNPYETYRMGEFEVRVLKHYQAPEQEAKNPNARVFTATKSPATMGSWEQGDAYLHEIQSTMRLVQEDKTVGETA